MELEVRKHLWVPVMSIQLNRHWENLTVEEELLRRLKILGAWNAAARREKEKQLQKRNRERVFKNIAMVPYSPDGFRWGVIVKDKYICTH